MSELSASLHGGEGVDADAYCLRRVVAVGAVRAGEYVAA